jgi:hypothetical protein
MAGSRRKNSWLARRSRAVNQIQFFWMVPPAGFEPVCRVGVGWLVELVFCWVELGFWPDTDVTFVDSA